MTIISEQQFKMQLTAILGAWKWMRNEKKEPLPKCVTGPGRSGAVAAVYASYFLHIPFIPFGCPIPDSLRPILIVDTASQSGATLRKAVRQYSAEYAEFFYQEVQRIHFWFELIEEKR